MQELEFLDRTMAHSNLASEVLFAGQPCGDWRLSVPGLGRATFHLVIEGRPWLHMPDAGVAARRLEPGDFVFLPRDAAHVVTESAEAPVLRDTAVERIEALGSVEGRSGLICGRVGMEAGVRRFLLTPLPEVVVMSSSDSRAPAIVSGIVTAMWHEARSHHPPLTMTLNRLADVLIAQVVRYAVKEGMVSSGMFAGLADPQLRRSILALLESPEDSWTVETLAARALMSRSAFAARFLAVVGRTPLEFVREWRMHAAATLLRAGRSVAEAAASTGYETEASFAKAFKRVMGVGPGALRPR
jgi:AraC-like DNA-binding protein